MTLSYVHENQYSAVVRVVEWGNLVLNPLFGHAAPEVTLARSFFLSLIYFLEL